MKPILIILFLGLCFGACTPTSLIYQGSSSLSSNYKKVVPANSKQFQKQKKARWQYRAKKHKIYAKSHH